MSIRTIAILVALVGSVAASQAASQCSCCSGAKKPETLAVAKLSKGVQKVTVVIDGGYAPSTITAKVGKPIVLTFFRKETSGCGGEIVFKTLGIRKSVANGKRVTVKITPRKPGTIPFTCGMNMYKGKIVVK